MSRIGASIFLLLSLITLSSCRQTPASTAQNRVEALLKTKQYDDALRLIDERLLKAPTSRRLLEDRLLLLLGNGNREVRGLLLETQKRLDALGMGRQLLIDQAAHPLSIVRQQVAFLLGALDQRSAQDTLRYLAEDVSPEVRAEAIHALGRFANLENRNLLLIRVRDPNWMVRSESASALASLGDSTVTAQLFRLANDDDDYAREQVLDAILTLARLSEKAVYLKNLASPKVGQQTAAALALAALQQNEELPVLLNLLKDKRNPDRARLARALVQTNGNQSAFEMEKLLRTETDPDIQETLLEWFQSRDDPQAARIKARYTRSAN